MPEWPKPTPANTSNSSQSDLSLFELPQFYARCRAEIPKNAKLQAQFKDMVEVVANVGRIAKGFACSTGLRLVPMRNIVTTTQQAPGPVLIGRFFEEFGAQSAVGLEPRPLLVSNLHPGMEYKLIKKYRSFVALQLSIFLT
ncbi:hypothetical protein EI94DRAFT_1800947 [Lactarius quietus]|nr:hypothetical protein EI94DRAFT_1800947 [Lactarius quietus]